MKKFAYLLLACIALPVLAATDAPSESVTAVDFFRSIEGNYTITKAGGSAPSADDTQGAVEVNALSTKFTFPYCIPNGACFLGITSFIHATTQVSHVASADSDIYTLQVNTLHGPTKYQWEVQSGGKIIFRNFQFHVSSTQTIILEMELEKAP